ncbi:MAG TPA: TRAG family protein [Cyanobacteria bacterium UBA11369]|nr:TRAG family protein [Cyanobacteria bacterium UBA11371]HBE31300.1 TRAG family protein [Cyanobacteria bacterium UBA11368]HBE53305.1 TRAG family protein [Cyanobacteria bacterium UBA11369]
MKSSQFLPQKSQAVLLQTASQPPKRPLFGVDFRGLFGQFMNPEGLAMLGLLLGLVIFSKIVGTSKGKVTSGRLCGTAEKMTATGLALNQMKEKKRQPVTLWSGTPTYWLAGKWKGLIAQLQTMLGASPTVWFPHSERGILVIGAPGSGKTFSVIDRLVESAFQQGFPVIIYDKKGDQMKLHAPLAVRYGYDVQVFAPGEAYSGVINPLDFMRDAQDAVMAAEIGSVIARNASLGDSKGNEFFEKAGELMAKGLVQLAKSSPYPDLAMIYAIIQLPDLVKRIDHAVRRPDGHPLKMDRWIASSFSQLLSSKDAEKTVAGIKATAEATYSAFIQKDLLRAFIGCSTIPIVLEGKKCIIFKLDDQRRAVVGPLLAAAIHLCVVSNLSRVRTEPFVYCLDEFPSLKFDRMDQWANEYRSAGGVPIVGIQSLNQLDNLYGDKKGAAIASALSTHVLFNPGDFDTAEKYSKRYGEVEVLVKNRSTGSSMGQQTSRSVNWSEQLQKKPLISADEILRFPQGKCVITSPAYGSETEALFPYPLKIPVKPSDIKRAKESEALWDTHIRPQLEKRAIQQSIDRQTGRSINIDEELDNRIRAAYELLPHPNDPTDPVTTADVQSSQKAAGEIFLSKIREQLKCTAIRGVRRE